jgi:hypothetical protein
MANEGSGDLAPLKRAVGLSGPAHVGDVNRSALERSAAGGRASPRHDRMPFHELLKVRRIAVAWQQRGYRRRSGASAQGSTDPRGFRRGVWGSRSRSCSGRGRATRPHRTLKIERSRCRGIEVVAQVGVPAASSALAGALAMNRPVQSDQQ